MPQRKFAGSGVYSGVGVLGWGRDLNRDLSREDKARGSLRENRSSKGLILFSFFFPTDFLASK